MRTYWLSFADIHRPEGQRFLGVLVIDVTDAERDAALSEVIVGHTDPEGAAWLIAAIRKAWKAKANPGGEIMASDITNHDPTYLRSLPRLTLLTKEDCARLNARPIYDR